MTYDILATGSSGNAVVINGEILIDIGVPYKTLEKSGYVKDLKLVLLTHRHLDHFNPKTAGRLHRERPALRWGCCEWMVAPLLEAGIDKQLIHVYKIEWTHFYNFYSDIPTIAICPHNLIHDVPNCGYSIGIGGESLFYATDTSTLDHVEAKDYAWYLLEANHTQAEISARIEDKLSRGEFAYEVRAAQNHLSQEQALDWLARNAGPNSQYVFLHQHKSKKGGNA